MHVRHPVDTPLTPKAKAPTLASVVASARQLSSLPLGALLGLCVTGAVHWFAPEFSPDGWAAAPFTLFCLSLGVAVERTVHWAFGWYIDTTLHHLAARREADLALKRLHEYEAEGAIDKEEATRLALRIGKVGVLGPAKARHRKSTTVPARRKRAAAAVKPLAKAANPANPTA